ncbi:hypothetical protein QCA50_012078 [Cerrena zonata]|uniref:Uncharacterized protein n=1 Tax=Cerrena zonata TaxID=2478898 RepID=A0AAW0G361_9APHY
MPIVDAEHSTYDSDNVSTESEELDAGAEDVDTENELESAEPKQPEVVPDEDDAAGDSDEEEGLRVVYENDRFRIKLIIVPTFWQVPLLIGISIADLIPLSTI